MRLNESSGNIHCCTLFCHYMVKIRCCIIHFYSLLINNTGYRIAGNFWGSKLSWIRPKIIFTELIFANFIIQPFLYHIFHNFANFIFAILKKSRKEWKLLALKVSGYTAFWSGGWQSFTSLPGSQYAHYFHWWGQEPKVNVTAFIGTRNRCDCLAHFTTRTGKKWLSIVETIISST